jgi:hypothetical protein
VITQPQQRAKGQQLCEHITLQSARPMQTDSTDLEMSAAQLVLVNEEQVPLTRPYCAKVTPVITPPTGQASCKVELSAPSAQVGGGGGAGPRQTLAHSFSGMPSSAGTHADALHTKSVGGGGGGEEAPVGSDMFATAATACIVSIVRKPRSSITGLLVDRAVGPVQQAAAGACSLSV